MKSTNFEFLRDTWPELADLGAFAEQYAQVDPAGPLARMKILEEQRYQGATAAEASPRLEKWQSGFNGVEFLHSSLSIRRFAGELGPSCGVQAFVESR